MQHIGACTCITLILCVAPCSSPDLRLVGGANSSEGRVEVCFDQQWGTVCESRFEDVDAGVVCRQLGYSRHSKDLSDY